MKFKLKCPTPTRKQLHGYSPSEFKTLLKRKGFKVGRGFFNKDGSVASRNGRLYRFRWWSGNNEFFVDVSCPTADFDRWANSTDNVVQFYNWIEDVSKSR